MARFKAELSVRHCKLLGKGFKAKVGSFHYTSHIFPRYYEFLPAAACPPTNVYTAQHSMGEGLGEWWEGLYSRKSLGV